MNLNLQCDVFIYVSCAQTALLDSKEFLAPVITPFEAMLAFTRYSCGYILPSSRFHFMLSYKISVIRTPKAKKLFCHFLLIADGS